MSFMFPVNIVLRKTGVVFYLLWVARVVVIVLLFAMIEIDMYLDMDAKAHIPVIRLSSGTSATSGSSLMTIPVEGRNWYMRNSLPVLSIPL